MYTGKAWPALVSCLLSTQFSLLQQIKLLLISCYNRFSSQLERWDSYAVLVIYRKIYINIFMEKLVHVKQYANPTWVRPIFSHCRAYHIVRKINKFNCNKSPSTISLRPIPLSESMTGHKSELGSENMIAIAITIRDVQIREHKITSNLLNTKLHLIYLFHTFAIVWNDG